MEVKIIPKEKSTVEINLTLPASVFESYQDKAVLALQERMTIDGFRQGKAPLDVVKQHAGQGAILDEMAHLAIIDAYPKIIEEHKLDAIGRPTIMITKMALGNPLECTITTTVLPQVALPDYKKLAAKINGKKLENAEVTEAEINNAIKELLRFRAHHEMLETNPEAKISDVKDDALPELTDDIVKNYGPFESKADFIAKLTENMAAEKLERAKEKQRIDVMEAIVTETKAEVPEMLVDYELSKMLAQLEHDITRAGMTLDGYLKETGKTKDDLKKDWYAEGEKRGKMQLIMNHIALAEKIEIQEADIEHEISHIMEQYKGQPIDAENVRAYVISMMTNKKVLQFLEEQK